MRVVSSVITLTLAIGFPAEAQSVPEGVHTIADGPSQLCGLVGSSIPDLIAKARQSAQLRPLPIESDRFEMFESVEPMKFQLVITLPSEPAFPAASCRETYEQDGSWHMKRSMRCDAGREACDALFLEFQALDEQFTQAVRGRAT